jgi:hypothetical protein
VVALALASGIAPDVWLRQDDRVIETAWALLEEQNKQQGKQPKATFSG